MEKFKLSINVLLFMLPAFTALAETKQYNVEIVIFEDRSKHYLDSEQWPIITSSSEDSTATKLIEEASEDISLNTQTDSKIDESFDYKDAEHLETNNALNINHEVSNVLAEHVAKLKRSSRYNVLVHKSWQQTGLSNDDAINIQIDSTQHKGSNNEDISKFKAENESSKLDEKKIESNVQGSIKLILGRYLHIHTNLHYKRLMDTYSSNTLALNSNIFNEFKIQSQRRMRSNELHYIDHPLLGILVMVSPIIKPESET